MDNKPKNILANIESGELKKRPKWQFVLQTCLIALGEAVLFAVAIFLISFVFELLVSANFSFFPHVAGQGFGFYLQMFPWVPVFGGLLLIIILGFIFNKYSFVYRKPLIYLLLGIIAVIAVATFIIHITSFHDRFYRYTTQHRFPIIRQFYGQYRVPQK
jgi:hypothetical protein